MYHIFTWVRYFIDKAGKLALLIGYVIRILNKQELY